MGRNYKKTTSSKYAISAERSCQDIADELGLCKATVAVAAKRGLKKIAHSILEELGEDTSDERVEWLATTEGLADILRQLFAQQHEPYSDAAKKGKWRGVTKGNYDVCR